MAQDTVYQYEETQALLWQRKAESILAQFVNTRKFQGSLWAFGIVVNATTHLLAALGNHLLELLMLTVEF